MPEKLFLPLDDPAMRLIGASADEADITKKLYGYNKGKWAFIQAESHKVLFLGLKEEMGG